MPLRTSLHRKPASGRWPNRNTKRREVLSVNMISLPLADFRHLSHIGNDSHTDSFGDLSFLKMGHNLLLQSSQSEQNLFLACSPPPKPPRVNLEEAEGSESPDWHVGRLHMSQKKKICNSMPLLDNEDGEAEMEKEDGYKRGNNVSPNLAHSGGRGSLNSDRDEDSTETFDKTVGLQHKEEDSGFSFSLDLGPSILDDVLQVMDKLHK
ncbi:cdc42 effector protein 3 [Gymnodraco acuticeps]|uniref:Cdc42 effector protein 3 n=1 Tax=Gymnodraco acuticeps TaxID=8218 RepID=A0A6P8UNY9_GYMAC|nr:cdc42 effector protein 3 [Gymnodraco acuticeps]XP_034078134.1 cdc42 effector protein 3 [Gymnodraco acuticeps]XP_034078135.1 cdc42 effector protein 3 [Gymnodraco acuticeps]XP_034078136.1 cdc42 effector protein 3 [Gymnodraco acuticeps]